MQKCPCQKAAPELSRSGSLRIQRGGQLDWIPMGISWAISECSRPTLLPGMGTEQEARRTLQSVIQDLAQIGGQGQWHAPSGF